MTVYQTFSEEDIQHVARSATRRALREIDNMPYDAVRQHWADLEQEAALLALETLQKRSSQDDVWHIGQLVCYVAIALRHYIARQLWPDALDKGLAESVDDAIDVPGMVYIHRGQAQHCIRRPVENALIRRELDQGEQVSVSQMVQFERQIARILAFMGLRQRMRPDGRRIRIGAHVHARILLGSTPKEVAEELGLKRQRVRHIQHQDRQQIEAFLELPPEEQARASEVLYWWDELTEERLHTPRDFYLVTEHGTFYIHYQAAVSLPFRIGIRETARRPDGTKCGIRQRLPKPHKLTKVTAWAAIEQLRQKLDECQRPSIRERYSAALNGRPTQVAAQSYLALAAD